jgi:hypothetical protein
VAKILNEVLDITVNFNVSLYSDCQLANVLYHYNHICIIVINIGIYCKLQCFFYMSCMIVNYLTLHHTTVIVAVILYINMITYCNTHFGASNVRHVSGYI